VVSARTEADGRRIEFAVNALLGAIEAGSWDASDGSFDEDAVIFLARAEGEEIVLWRDLRDAIRPFFERGGPTPLNVRRRQGLAVQLAGKNAFVSFHLPDRRRIGKRAIIFSMVGGRCLVRHLHTARLPVPWPEE